MSKKTLILAALLVVLVLLAFLVLERTGERSESVDETEHLFEIDSAAVDGVELQSRELAVVLRKRGGEWRLEAPIQYRADQGNVASLIGQLKNLGIRAVVSSNPEKQSIFEVDSTGTSVVLRIGEKPAAGLIIGKMGSTWSETYVRRPDDREVLLVDASLAPLRTRGLKEWRDRGIASVPRETIDRVEFQYGDTTFALVREDSVWRVGGQTVEDWSVSSLLSALADVKADDFVDTPPQPMPRISAMLRYSGQELRFAKPKDRESYYVQSSSSPQWYELQSWRAAQLLKRKNDLVKK